MPISVLGNFKYFISQNPHANRVMMLYVRKEMIRKPILEEVN